MKSWVQNLIKAITVVGMICVPAGIALYTPSKPAPFYQSSKIVGPEKAEIGELVRLKIEGDDVEWKILPETPDFQVFGENNQNMVVSFRKGGEYSVIAAVITPETELEIETLKITVGGDELTPVVQPDAPPVVVVQTYDKAIEAKVAKWATEAHLTKDLACDLRDRFRLVADEISQEELTTPEGVVARTSHLISSLDLKSYATLLENLQNLLVSKADEGHLTTMDDHRYIWHSIAQGFDLASQSAADEWSGEKATVYRGR